MRLSLTLVLLLFPAVLNAASAKLMKVLRHFIDREESHTPSPSLYKRDAYQQELRLKPEMRSALRFDVQWKGRAKFHWCCALNCEAVAPHRNAHV